MNSSKLYWHTIYVKKEGKTFSQFSVLQSFSVLVIQSSFFLSKSQLILEKRVTLLLQSYNRTVIRRRLYIWHRITRVANRLASILNARILLCLWLKTKVYFFQRYSSQTVRRRHLDQFTFLIFLEYKKVIVFEINLQD